MFQSPDGRFIACGAIDGIINIFDLAGGKLLHTLEGMMIQLVIKRGGGGGGLV